MAFLGWLIHVTGKPDAIEDNNGGFGLRSHNVNRSWGHGQPVSETGCSTMLLEPSILYMVGLGGEISGGWGDSSAGKVLVA